MLCRRYPAYTPETARQADVSVLRHMAIIDLAYPPERAPAVEPAEVD